MPSFAIRFSSLGIVLLLAGTTVHAKPAHKKALADDLGPRLAPRLNDCRTCHLPDQPGAAKEGSDKPHNPFGARLAAVKDELKKAGKKTDIISRIHAIANEDSDGDGVPNLLELFSGHNPGEKTDRPTDAELATARKTLADYLKSRAEYVWSPFDSVQRPPVPRPKEDMSRHPIDAFLAVERAKHGLKARPEAPRHVLLRRVYLDLIGLPPTREEMRAFLADSSPDAYEKVVDRLLADPRHGERWGRHWMDVWRYADWAGYSEEVRDSQRHIWHWRDWIVESLNADKGYDRMIVEMLAGDEVAPDDPATLRATGFLARNWYRFNRNVWLDNTIEHTAKAFLGVTMNCARCHDHFFDPIGQREYYEFRAFFETHDVRTDRVPGHPDLSKDGLPRVYDAHLTATTHLFVRGEESRPDKGKALVPGVPAALGGPPLKVEPVKLPPLASMPDKRDFVIAETLAASRASVTTARQALEAARRNIALADIQAVLHDSLRLTTTPPAMRKTLDALALAEATAAAADANHAALEAVLLVERLEDTGKKDSEEWKQTATKATALQRSAAFQTAKRDFLAARQVRQTAPAQGQAAASQKLTAAEQALTKAEAAAKQPPTTAYTKRPVPTFPATSSGRRLALARWIADRQNPLTARVAVNHLWMRHFGKPLAPTVFDFGRNGQPPSHPELLDWLAAEFMSTGEPGVSAPGGGWSMKAMHRLLVTSAAYRMDSTADVASLAADADNRWLWRMNPRRMEAEAVRDSVLQVSGMLDGTMGGPDLDHNLGLMSPRRSLYFRHAAEKQMEFLYLFDAAGVSECYRRSESIVPQQALALANSSLALAQSRRLARKLYAEATDPAAFVKLGFEQVLGRPPTAAEQAECEKFLTAQAALLADPKKLSGFGAGPPCPVPPSTEPELRAREDLIHVLLNHHEFVTIR